MELHSLKVKRGIVDSWFPFDRLYLVKFQDREHLKRLFRYAIVMPLTKETLKMFEDLSVDRHITRQHERTAREEGSFSDASIKLKHRLDLENQQWLAVIPLLPSKTKPGETMNPRYMTAPNWRFRDNRLTGESGKTVRQSLRHLGRKAPAEKIPESPFNSQAYLQTPERNIRPPCMFCPRMILQQAGECQLGDKVCYSNLPLGLQAALDHADEMHVEEARDHEEEVENGVI